MNTQQRLNASTELLDRSNEEFDTGGNTMIAAELLWGGLRPTIPGCSRTPRLAGIEPRSVSQHRNQIACLAGVRIMGFGLGIRGKTAFPLLPGQPESD